MVYYTNMWQALASAWQEKSQLYYTTERALRDVMVIESVHQSIKSGQRVAAVKSDMIES